MINPVLREPVIIDIIDWHWDAHLLYYTRLLKPLPG